uniref:Uncharacterized protein n=1 Tax=Anguilla anguilla TaxID=7936 RepID=A0A0E9QXX9_ANGAN
MSVMRLSPIAYRDVMGVLHPLCRQPAV